MTMHYRRTLVLAATLLLLPGCGSDDDSADPGPATTIAQDSGTAQSSTTTAPQNGGEDDVEMSPENCPELVAAIGGAANVAAGAVTGNPSTEFVVENTRALADRIPEIADDLNLIADAYEAFLTRLAELGVDFTDPSSIMSLDPATMEEVTAAAEALDAEDLAEANQRIEAFFERECS